MDCRYVRSRETWPGWRRSPGTGIRPPWRRPAAPPVPGGPWTIGDYVEPVRQMLAAHGVAPRARPPSEDAELLRALTAPTAKTVQKWNGRVSDALRIDFTRAEPVARKHGAAVGCVRAA